MTQTEAQSRRMSSIGASSTAHVAPRTIVALRSRSYGSHAGRPAAEGRPVLAKDSHASWTFAESARAS